MIGAGGYLGALTTTWLNNHFATVGSFILTSAVMIAGLLLSTDYVVLRWLGWFMNETVSLAGNTAVVGRRGLSSLNPLAGLAARMRRSDVDEGVVLPDSNIDNVSIRIRGQQVGQPIEGKAAPAAAVAAAPAAAAGAVTAAAASTNKAASKTADSLIAGVAAVASNLLNGKLKAESAEEEEDEEAEELDGDEEGSEDAEAGDEEAAAAEEAEPADDGPRGKTQKETSRSEKGR